MIRIYIRHPERGKYYKATVSARWANRHDNGALVSCGLTVDEPSAWSSRIWLTDRAFRRLESTGAVVEVTQEKWNHSGCQSSCVLRGGKECRW